MNSTGAQEMLMPFVQPAELWQKSGRWNVYGKELLRCVDRHENQMCLAPTHEEVVTSVVADIVNSYKQLPLNVYHIQLKFRDEIRPRFGLLRGREFIMKDAYSFHASQEDLDREYEVMGRTYTNIFKRCGLDTRAVQSDSGAIGGSVSHEYMVLTDTAVGENDVFYCDECGYSANSNHADSFLPVEIVDGDFDLDATNITRFKNLKVVNGNLDLSNSLMETTGSLERVRGELKLDSTKTEIGDNLVDVEKGIYDTSEPYGTNNYLNAIVLLNKISNAKSKKKILEALGIKAKELEDGTLKIASYNPSELENFILLRSYTEDPFSAMGIDEEDLLDGVSTIVGDLNLQDTNITTVKTVKKVGGDVILGNSNLKSLGSIKGVRGNIYAHDSKLKSLGNLIIVGGDADFSNTNITSTRYLKKVGGNLNLKNTNVKKINYLTGENLGGKLYIDPYLFPMLDETLYQLGLEDKTIIE